MEANSSSTEKSANEQRTDTKTSSANSRSKPSGVFVIASMFGILGVILLCGSLLAYGLTPSSMIDQRPRIVAFLITATSTATPTSTATLTPLPSPTVTPTFTATVSGSPAPSLTPTLTPTPTNTATPQPTADSLERTFRVPILMYHYISTPPDNADIYRRDLSVTPETFRAQMNWLADNGYQSITISDLVYALNIGWPPLPQKPVIITFDDGYIDNYQNAYPILRDNNLNGSFFILTDVTDRAEPGYMTWEMLREMHSNGMDIQVHGREHIEYSDRNYDWLVFHLLGPMETIEAELGYRPRIIAYTAGRYDQLTIQVAQEMGYWAGLTTQWGAVHDKENLYEISRLRVTEDWGIDTFAAVLRGE